jgi:ethanolamine utilization protein EutA
MAASWISVGVDVGTATTKVVISRLHFTAGGLAGARVTGREVLCRNRLETTPVADGRLNGEALLSFMAAAYGEAGVDPGAVRSGGVIITGEAARASNAAALVELLAHRAGDFVVATAGPHLEAVLAGRGSGAAARSETTGGTVAAVDIGGGTANIALFRQGQAVETACVRLGGKALRLDPETGRVLSLGAARSVGAPAVRVGDCLDRPALEAVGRWMAEVIVGALFGGDVGELLEGPPLSGAHRVDEVLLSGGVGDLLDDDGNLLRFGDIGPALGRALRPALEATGLRVGRPAETSFATVIGVGLHSLSLSGATVHLPDPTVLPLRNVPVVRPSAGAARLPTEGPVAVALGPLVDLSFDGLRKAAEGLRPWQQPGRPLVVVAEQNVAAALGLFLGNGAIVLDELAAADGQYLDIGRPLGDLVPVVIKTLVFAAEGGL